MTQTGLGKPPLHCFDICKLQQHTLKCSSQSTQWTVSCIPPFYNSTITTWVRMWDDDPKHFSCITGKCYRISWAMFQYRNGTTWFQQVEASPRFVLGAFLNNRFLWWFPVQWWPDTPQFLSPVTYEKHPRRNQELMKNTSKFTKIIR